VKRVVFVLGAAVICAASAWAQETVVTRRGDGTVVIPGEPGPVTVTTHTEGARQARRAVRLDEKQLEKFLREHTTRDKAWT
jgi:hypothetical protein